MDLNWAIIGPIFAIISFLFLIKTWQESFPKLEIRLKSKERLSFGWTNSPRDNCFTSFDISDVWIENKSSRPIKISKVSFFSCRPLAAESITANLHYSSPKDVDGFKTVSAILETKISTKASEPFLGKVILIIRFEDSKGRKWQLKTQAIFTRLAM